MASHLLRPSAKKVTILLLVIGGVVVTVPAWGAGMPKPHQSDHSKKSLSSISDVPVARTADAKRSAPVDKPIPSPDPAKSKKPVQPAPPPPPPVVAPAPDQYQVNEQFTGSSLNSSLWEAMTFPKGYRNNEEQDYRPSQVSVANGNLQITANRDASGAWHSGEVHSKWNYTYGEFEVRMAVSAVGSGVWPAAWLMGTTDTWPNNGELDIMEHINAESVVYGTIHGGGSKGAWQLQSIFYPIDVTAFHTYKIVKQPGIISWWVDGVKRGEWTKAQTPAGGMWPFENHRNFGLLNLAIGGNWPGPSNASTPGTVTMNVDYFTVKNGS